MYRISSFLIQIKNEISIDDFEEILNVLTSILVDYYQFVPVNPIELRFSTLAQQRYLQSIIHH